MERENFTSECVTLIENLKGAAFIVDGTLKNFISIEIWDGVGNIMNENTWSVIIGDIKNQIEDGRN